MDVAQLTATLRSIDLFEGFREEALAALVGACSLRTLAPKDMLFDHGDLGSSLFVVLEGEILVFRNARMIATLSTGDYIGEMAVIDTRPRLASAQVLCPTTLLEIPGDAFYKYLGGDAQALTAMLRKVCTRLRNLTDDTQHAYEAVNMLVHDMLNMVTILEGAWIVKNTLPEDDDRRDFLESIEHSQESLEAMMRYALRQARNIRVPYDMTPEDPERLVRDCLAFDIARHKDVRRVSVRVDVAAGLQPMVCNALDLRRVIANLVINAAQAIDGTGEVRITVAQDEERIRITVADDGPGIPAECLERIFEPHFTTKVEGNGLGLSSCKEIIERLHGGSLSCDSSGGKGATFLCEFPLRSR